MLTLPDAIVSLLSPFAPMFQVRTWSKVQVLLIGVILATRSRIATSALRAMGLSDDTGFSRSQPRSMVISTVEPSAAVAVDSTP